MLKQLFEIAGRLLGLARDTDENKTAIKELQRQVEDLTTAVQRLAFELQRLRENEAHEREKLALRFEVALLRRERGLPPGSPPPDSTEHEESR